LICQIYFNFYIFIQIMNTKENKNQPINSENENSIGENVNDIEMSNNKNKNTNEKKEIESKEEKEKNLKEENSIIKIKETENLDSKNIINNTASISEKKNKRNREKEKSIRRINNFSFIYERV
jgi:hypothetical protein